MLRLAVRTNADGEGHFVIAWGPTAQLCLKQLNAGAFVTIDGCLRTRDGYTDVIARSIQSPDLAQAPRGSTSSKKATPFKKSRGGGGVAPPRPMLIKRKASSPRGPNASPGRTSAPRSAE